MIETMAFPVLIAHRGHSAGYPENTLAAFRAAAESGVGMIELDITLTLDRQMVVFHDDTLHRTTNGRGTVRAKTLDALKRLDAGSWFGPDFKGEPIPTLDEVLVAMPPELAVNIEIKPEAVESPAPADAIERRLMGCLRNHDAMNRVLVSSFSPEVLKRLSLETPPPLLALLTDQGVSRPPLDILKRIRAFSWNAHHGDLTEKKVKTAHDAGFRVFAYTVNSPDRIAECFRMGVDAIFTDDPTPGDRVSR